MTDPNSINDTRPYNVVLSCRQEHRDLLRRLADHDTETLKEPRTMTATLGLLLREAAERRGVEVV